MDWNGYTVHDAANILRRYLNQLPQPIVPLDFYERCREPLRCHQAQAVGDMEAQAQDIGNFDQAAAIRTYQRLITELPPLNRQLLLYILDLLAVFSSKSDLNRMNSANLAAIFQPGLLSHPTHDMKPHEYRLSQDVLIFLIENQDSFLIGMNGTAADEKTVKEVQNGLPPRKTHSPSTPRTPLTALGRSASNASGGADSLRRFGGLRRNASVSSKHSRTSTNMPSPMGSIPGSPHGGVTSVVGVQRSNTAPSKKSPGIPSTRFGKPIDSPTSAATSLQPSGQLTPTGRASSPGQKVVQPASSGRTSSTTSSVTPPTDNYAGLATVEESVLHSSVRGQQSQVEKLGVEPSLQGNASQPSTTTPNKGSKAPGLFTKSPISDSDRRETRQPKKLRKKRPPESSNPSAQSSTQSLHGTPESPLNPGFYTPMPTPGTTSQRLTDPLSNMLPMFSNTVATPPLDLSSQTGDGNQDVSRTPLRPQFPPLTMSSLKPLPSPVPSIRSRTSATDLSEIDHTDDLTVKDVNENGKRHSRLSSSFIKTSGSTVNRPTSAQLGYNAVAEISNTSIGSSKTRNSIAPHKPSTDVSTMSNLQTSSTDSTPSKEKDGSKDKDHPQENPEGRRGPIGWFKAKVAQAKEERKEREAEKERAKSPPRNGSEPATSQQASLSVINQELPHRGRSVDAGLMGLEDQKKTTAHYPSES